jgi:site-specific DNA recombinase
MTIRRREVEPMTRHATITLRVSTGKQADSGLGLAAQEHACREWCAANGYTVRHVFKDEGLSGSLPVDKRPGLLDAIGSLESGDVLCAARRDRLARDVIVAALVERMVLARGARIVSAAGEASDLEGPTGALVRTVLDAVAQFERANAAMRTRAAMAQLKRNGSYTGGRPPYGHKVVSGRLVLDDDEVEIIRLAKALKVDGLGSTRAARRLNEVGMRSRAGKEFSSMQVLRMWKWEPAPGLSL